MSLQVLVGERLLPYDQVELDFEASPDSFILSCSEGLIDPFIIHSQIPFAEVGAAFYSTEDLEQTYLFKNPYLPTNKVYELRTNARAGGSGLFGYVVPMQLLVDELDLDLSDYHKTAIFRSELSLAKGSVPSKQPVYRPGPWSLEDFYSPDVFIAVFPTVFINGIIDFNLVEQYLLPLSLIGFTLINKPSHLEFSCSRSRLQDNYISDLLQNHPNYSDVAILRVNPLTVDLSSRDFIYNLYKNYNKEESNFLSRFLLMYQVVEILTDIVMRKDLEELWRDLQNNNNRSGYQLKEKVLEIGTDSFKVQHLFNKYSNLQGDMDMVILTLNDFFSKYTNLAGRGDDFALSSLIYKLRNQIVHNTQFIYENPELTADIIESIKQITAEFEYIVVQALVRFSY